MTARTVLLCLALFASLSFQSVQRRPAQGATGRPDIILITVDSLRADALGCYGYTRPTSPRLDQFAQQAVVITDAIAQAPYTKASVASLMTGLFPGSHKTYTTTNEPSAIMKGNGRVKGPFEITDVLPPELPTLAERLHAAGYRTVGLNTNPFLIAEFGYGRGFDEYRFFNHGEAYTRAAPVLAQALAVLRAPRTQPMFIWIHLMDTHNPYTPSAAFRAMFAPEKPPRLVPSSVIAPAAQIEDSLDVHLYRARYDACVREMDAQVGAFFDALGSAGLWSNAAVVVTADHGEEFLEHGRMGHSTDLYDAQVRVPLIMKIPGVRAARLSIAAQLLDLYPTLVHLGAGAQASWHVHGDDLMPVVSGAASPEHYAFSEIPGRMWCVQSRDWKMISRLNGTDELYNLAATPGEKQNLADQQRSQAATLHRILAGMVSLEMRDGRKLHARTVPMDPRIVEQLRALGYLGPATP